MKKVRMSIFETNSSSSHSLILSDTDPKDSLMDTSLKPDRDGNLVVRARTTEFGWEFDSYTDAGTKAMYCYIDQKEDQSNILMLIEVIKEQTGAKTVTFECGDGYIDHQSVGLTDEIFSSFNKLRQFIFDKASHLETGNDNV